MENNYELLDLEELKFEIESLDSKEEMLFEAKKIEREFISNLVNLRKSQGLTQTQLAEKTGLTQQVISNIEKMDRKPTLTNIIRYVLGLGVNINNLISIQ